MEMNDHLLGPYKTVKQRNFEILKWAKSNMQVKFNGVHHFQKVATEEWEKKEREASWPALLQRNLGIPLVNLARIGSSIGYALIKFSNLLRQNIEEKKKILVIHQLPGFARMYMRFNTEYGRIDVTPSDIDGDNNFGFNKSYFKDEINKVNRVYKKRILRDGYLEEHTKRILYRLEKISSDFEIKNYYITPKNNSGSYLPRQKVLLDDFRTFRSHYPKGALGHPIGNDFNVDLCDMITTTCF